MADLSGRVRDLCESPPVADLLGRLSDMDARLFGGVIRSLRLGREPRDVDLVVNATAKELERRLGPLVVRRTRFGGLKVAVGDRPADVWALADTLAFREDRVCDPSFEDLLGTTFLSVEAVLARVEPPYDVVGPAFSRAFEVRVLEVVRESNPFPALCLGRAFAIADETGFALGPRLLATLRDFAGRVADAEIEREQVKHYGAVRVAASYIRERL